MDDEELIAMIAVSSCEEAMEMMGPDSWRCPSCLEPIELDGVLYHKERILH